MRGYNRFKSVPKHARQQNNSQQGGQQTEGIGVDDVVEETDQAVSDPTPELATLTLLLLGLLKVSGIQFQRDGNVEVILVGKIQGNKRTQTMQAEAKRKNKKIKKNRNK